MIKRSKFELLTTTMDGRTTVAIYFHNVLDVFQHGRKWGKGVHMDYTIGFLQSEQTHHVKKINDSLLLCHLNLSK